MLVEYLLLERFTIAQESNFAGTFEVSFFTEVLRLVCKWRIACVSVALLAIFSFDPPLLRKRRFWFCGINFSLLSLMRTCLIIQFLVLARGAPHSEELELS